MAVAMKRSCMLLLALPLCAVAAPVAVTTHSTGIHGTNADSLGTTNSMLNVLGLEPRASRSVSKAVFAR